MRDCQDQDGMSRIFLDFLLKKWLNRDDTKESQKASRKSSFVNLTKRPPWWPASVRFHRGCACANAMIWESLPRTHPSRCTRSLARDSSAAKLRAEYLCLRPDCACW